MKKITILATLLVAVQVCFTQISCQAEESKVPTFFPKMKAVENSVYIDISRDSEEANHISRVFQGVVNRDSAEVFLAGGHQEVNWLRLSGKRCVKPEGHIADGEDRGLRTLFKMYGNRIDKLVVCRFEDNDYTWNMGVMMASVENVLPVSERVRKMLVEEFGWDKPVVDIRNRWNSSTEAYDWALDELMPRMNKTLMFSLGLRSDWRSMSWRLYDYAVATRSFVFWLDNHSEEGLAMIRKILNTPGYPRNSFVMGYGMYGDDLNDAINPEGFGFLVGDIFPNASYYSSLPSQGFKQRNGVDHTAQKGKIYVALHWSDGDNIQFNHNASLEIFSQPARGKVPVSMTLSPALMEIAPMILKYYYDNQSECDEFIGGPSGYQYIQEPFYKKADYESWCEQNGRWLAACGMNVTASSLRWPAQAFYNNGFLKCGLAGTIAWTNSSYQDAYNWVGMPVIATGQNIAQEQDLYNYLANLAPSSNRPLFTSAYMIQAPFGVHGYAAINRVAERLQREFPDRFEFLLASDIMVTAKNYFEKEQKPLKKHLLPCRIEAEDFDHGCQGAGFYDRSYKNEGGAYRVADGDYVGVSQSVGGGYRVSWTEAGEWLNYSVVVGKSGEYTVEFSYSTPHSGRRLLLMNDDQILFECTLKPMGDATVLGLHSEHVTLEKGRHNLKLQFVDGGVDVDYMDFKKR